MYILDRFEENFAVIEYTDKYGEISMIKEAKNTVSPEVKEGDVLCLNDGIYITDEKATKERRNKIKTKLSNTGKRKKGKILKALRIYVTINCVYLIVAITFTSTWFYYNLFSSDFMQFIEEYSFLSLIFYVFCGMFAIHVILDIGLLIYSIYNRVKWRVKKGFVFTLIIIFLSIILNVCGNSLAVLVCSQ